MHVVVDDHSRYATVRVKEDETTESVTKQLLETYQLHASIGIVVKQSLTDDGSGAKENVC